ncbi:uncharacterized protein LOC124206096 isoform X1 [Daphnia pulex]|uniref:uncharacterized protein LOC124206096 isoform X1 n=1 Tax=Daphnia pulex TaxID=6669 RepID=UPI001EE140B2|nr:uncharacterized protein LOC124206096 isoform X1 [Daphnia pulex]
MQATIFFLLSVSIALSASNPIADPGKILNEGDVIAVFDEDEPEQPAVLFVQQQQQPLDEFFVLESFNPDEQPKSDDCEGCDNQQAQTQERSFFFKKFFKPAVARPSVGLTVAIPKPQTVRLPPPIVVGTVYQPISFVTSPIATGGFAAAGSSGQFVGNAMTGLKGYLQGLLNSHLSAGQVSQPSLTLTPGAGGGVVDLGISGQQGLFSAGARPTQVSRPMMGISGSTGLGNVGFNMLEQQHGLLQGLLTGGHSIGQMLRPSTGLLSAGPSTGQGNVDVGMIGQQGLLQALFAGARPTMSQESRPPTGLFPSSGGQGNVGINIQQSILGSNSGPSSPNGSASASVHVSGGQQHQPQPQQPQPVLETTNKPLNPTPTPWSEVNIDKVIDVMAQAVKS